MKKIPCCLMLAGCVLILASCKTLNVGALGGKPSYDPKSYGTEALMQVIRQPSVSRRDGVSAAEELAHRTLTPEQGAQLLELLKLNRHSEINIALLKTMSSHNMDYLLDDMIAYQPRARDPETAAEAAAFIYQYIYDDVDRFEFMESLLLQSPHPNVRARAARVLASFNEMSEDAFILALGKEKSASVAMVMCQSLHSAGTEKSIAVLHAVANDVNRVFETDAFLGERATSVTVRAAAVQALEALKSQ